jgi:hypothetical protein
VLDNYNKVIKNGRIFEHNVKENNDNDIFKGARQ